MIDGMNSLLGKLKRLKREVDDNVANILLDAAITVKSEAQRSIQQRSSVGIWQARYRNGKKRMVVASAPNNPPNTDTGNLVRSIKARKTEKREAVVGVDGQLAPYGKWLEYGTDKMIQRPFLRPAYQNKKDIIREKLKALGKNIIDEAIK